MAVLSDTELDAMRDTLDTSLPELAEIERATKVSDGRGGETLTWTTVASVPCRVAPVLARPPADQVTADLVTNVQKWVLTFPAGTNLAPDDRMIVGARRFNLYAVTAPRSYAVSTRATATEVL